MFVPKFKITGAVAPEKFLTKNFIGEKENGQIEGMISMRMPILSYTIQVIVPNVCTNFQNPSSAVPEKPLTQIYLCIGSERWKKGIS